VAVARRKGLALPPVQVVEGSDGYYVVDGRNRVSVAVAAGQRDVEGADRMTPTCDPGTGPFFLDAMVKEPPSSRRCSQIARPQRPPETLGRASCMAGFPDRHHAGVSPRASSAASRARFARV
jgi:hypothetical protein